MCVNCWELLRVKKIWKPGDLWFPHLTPLAVHGPVHTKIPQAKHRRLAEVPGMTMWPIQLVNFSTREPSEQNFMKLWGKKYPQFVSSYWKKLLNMAKICKHPWKLPWFFSPKGTWKLEVDFPSPVRTLETYSFSISASDRLLTLPKGVVFAEVCTTSCSSKFEMMFGMLPICLACDLWETRQSIHNAVRTSGCLFVML